MLCNIAFCCFDNSRHQCSTHIREFFGNRVQDWNGCITAIPFRKHHIGKTIFMHEAKCNDLSHTQFSQSMCNLFNKSFLRCHTTRGQYGYRNCRSNIIVIVNTSYFFSDIRHHGYVTTPCWNKGRQLVAVFGYNELKGCQNTNHFVFFNVCTQVIIDLCCCESNCMLFYRIFIYIDNAYINFTSRANLLQ